jgi:hypothetical protein
MNKSLVKPIKVGDKFRNNYSNVVCIVIDATPDKKGRIKVKYNDLKSLKLEFKTEDAKMFFNKTDKIDQVGFLIFWRKINRTNKKGK